VAVSIGTKATSLGTGTSRPRCLVHALPDERTIFTSGL
jgi:hypothetical protein